MDFPSGGLRRDAEFFPARPVPVTDAVDPFLSLLHSISSSLSDEELSDLKALCQNLIPKGKREKVQRGVDLFSILRERQAITNTDLRFLRDLLKSIKREDLLSEVEQFEKKQPHAPGDQPDAHEKRLRAAVDVICANVGREWKKLMRQLGMPEVQLARIEAAYLFDLHEQLCQALWQWQRWKGKHAKVADLVKALRGCNLNLVADRVEERISQLEPDEISE